MLKIRLQRVGRVHEPYFRLVLTDSENSTKSGRFKEILGNYDARKGEKAVFDTEKIKTWISKGAKVSPTVHNLLIEKKVLTGKKINKLPKKTVIKKDEPVVDAQPKQEVKEEVSVQNEAVENQEQTS
jgi:small subunit ribosomal protein S16